MDRYVRQMRLIEVGAEGQARLARARVEIRVGGLAGEVAARYLAGAGIGSLRVSDPACADAARAIDPTVRIEPLSRCEASAPREELALADPSARDLARGSLLALRAVRAALDGSAEPRPL